MLTVRDFVVIAVVVAAVLWLASRAGKKCGCAGGAKLLGPGARELAAAAGARPSMCGVKR